MALVSDHMDSPNPGGPQDIPASRVWTMLKGIEIAMLVTRTGRALRGRPMTTLPDADTGLIYILAEADSASAGDIGSDGGVLLCYQGSGDYVALQAQARVDPDMGLVKQLWNTGAQAFWPDGPEAHGVVALVITPGRADVWKGDGMLVGMAKMVTAALTGNTPDLGDRGKAEL